MRISRKSYVVAAVLLLVAGAVWAFPPRVSWQPERLVPGSVAPGETSVLFAVIVHTGILPIPATNQLRVVAEGDIVPFVSIDQPKLPPVLKRGDRVSVRLTISAPTGVPMSVVRGNILLERVLPNGRVFDVFRAEALPVELTFSSIAMPGDPGQAGKEDILGIDTDGNGVRDDIDRYIVFTYPDSEKKREAFKQSARQLSAYLRDSGDKAKTRENGGIAGGKALDCLSYVFNDNLDAAFAADDVFRAQFLNTKERSRAYAQADRQMGGYVSNNGYLSERLARQKAACTFDADALPN